LIELNDFFGQIQSKSENIGVGEVGLRRGGATAPRLAVIRANLEHIREI